MPNRSFKGSSGAVPHRFGGSFIHAKTGPKPVGHGDRGYQGSRKVGTGGGYRGGTTGSGYRSGGHGGRSGGYNAGRGGSGYHGGHGGRGGGYRGGGNRGGGRGGAGFMDITKFVNKAVITEEAPNFVPEHQFTDFNIDNRLKANILKKGYKTPTPIQDRVINHVLKGQDVVGIANTGTGKTAAFLIPLIDKVLKNPQEKILIMVPTRELANQIDAELKEFARLLSIFSVCCVGGMPIYRQIQNLRRSNGFIIGTPGRLKDLLERKALNLTPFKTVVLDEADRMLDMGFIHDMKFMMSRMSPVRQTLFFSATMSRDIEVLIKDFLKEPVSISVKTGDTAKSIDQDVVRVGARNKLDVLHELLVQNDYSKVLIFGKTKHGVERLKDELVKRGFKSESIHGNKNQSKRQRALDLFKASGLQVLVATDVAARGIDVSDISHVINYDLPASYEDYVHRIGRTGRAGKKGKAITFI